MAISAPELWMAWRVPPATGIAASRLGVIARVVGRMLSRRLDPDGTNDVLDVAAWASPGRLSSAILCRFTLRSSNDATRIRDETRGALEALSDVTLIHMSRLRWNYQNALTEAILRTAFEMDSLRQRTQTEAALVHFESGAEPARVIEAFAKLSIEDIADFARRYLKPDDARAVLLLPEEVRNVTHGRFRPKDQPRAAQPPAGAPGPEPETEPEADADPDAIAAPEAAGAPEAAAVAKAHPPEPDLQSIVQAPGARAALVRRLSNGLSVIAMRRAGLPFVSMVLGFHADPQPGDAPGARYAFEHLLRWNLSAGPLDRGLLRTSALYADHSQETLTAFTGNLDAALDFINEEGDTLHVLFSDPGYNRWVDRMAVQATDPQDQAARAFRAALFGSHPYHLTPTAAAARTLTEREAETWFSRVRRPANGALVIVGDIVPENAVQAAEKMLRGWKGDTAPPPQPPAPPAPAARTADQAAGLQILHTNDPRRQSSYLRFGCFLPPVRSPRDDVVHHLLSSLMEANLRRRLRLAKGVTYGADVDPDYERGGTAALLGHLDVEAKATSDAVDVLRDWLDPARGAPITEKRVQRQRWNTARRSGLRHATGLALARSLLYAWNMGWEPAVLDDYPRDLASVTHKDVVAALDACRKSAVISVLGPGQN
jgi:predicted Zn-dependent peptidase